MARLTAKLFVTADILSCLAPRASVYGASQRTRYSVSAKACEGSGVLANIINASSLSDSARCPDALNGYMF
jgi:hypothetical protein